MILSHGRARIRFRIMFNIMSDKRTLFWVGIEMGYKGEALDYG